MTSDSKTSSPSRPQSRIAVLSAHDTGLVARLGAVAHRPLVRRFRDLYADVGAIRIFGAAALFVELPEYGPEDAGALRMVRSLMPDLPMVIVCGAAHEVELRELAGRLGASILISPFTRHRLTSVLDAVLDASGRPEAEALLDLVRGISDEVNNPLLFIGGHLQLLQRRLPADSDLVDHVRAIQGGFDRITQTMDKVRLLTRAGETALELREVDLGLLAETAAQRHREISAVGFAAAPPAGSALVEGDADLLEAMLEHLWLVTGGLTQAGGKARIEVETTPKTVLVRALLDADQLPAWQLPRTFEPYYLTRILRGTPHGLSLFVVQVIAQGHGGRAVARWAREGELLVEVEFGRAR